MHSFLVKEEHVGFKLRDLLKLKYPTFSNKQLKEYIDQGKALVNRKVERFYRRALLFGDEVSFLANVLKEELSILHESSDYIVVDKPAGFVCTQKNFRQALHQKLFLVHRLDKGTSGVMILAKTLSMQERLEDLFYQRAIQKEYLAITHPLECPQEICINEPLMIKKIGNKKFVSVHPKGLMAKTYVQCLSSSPTATLVRVRPVSGRIHQIRVHLQSMGASILGDLQYQPAQIETRVVPELMLHSTKLMIPFEYQKKMNFTSFLKENFLKELNFHGLQYTGLL